MPWKKIRRLSTDEWKKVLGIPHEEEETPYPNHYDKNERYVFEEELFAFGIDADKILGPEKKEE